MKNSLRRAVTATAATLLLGGVGAMLLVESASAAQVSTTTASTQADNVAGDVAKGPVHLPVNVCGNDLGQVGLLNPSAGNHCANVGVRA